MKKKISVLALASIFAAGSAMASGWRIPEQSVDSTAKAGANIASSTRADTAYFNPANMAWMENTFHLEADFTYIYLSAIDYEDSRNFPVSADGSSETEHFFVPTGFMVSPSYGGARFGLALTAPAGLSKQWEDPYPRSFAEEFSLQVIELNPTVSYSFGEMVSIAAGPRMLYASATVSSTSFFTPLLPNTSREMDGDTTEWGWNVALAVKPMEKLNISTTYRSNVDLDFEDDAYLRFGPVNNVFDAEVSVPVPAVFAISVAYDVLDNLNVELTWDRTFWSEYEQLDFNFTPVIPGNPFEVPQDRNWDDTNAFRIGLTFAMNDYLTLMGGFAYDENPAPDEHVGFELPDSDAWIYSIGAQYKVNDKMDVGIAALYDYKESRTVEVSPTNPVYGEFTNASAFLLTVGLNYRF
jgi:long-chain fatty acid transport protein